MVASSDAGPGSRRRWRVWARRAAMVVVGTTVVLIYGVFPMLATYLVTRATTRPGERNLTTTPAEFQAEYADIEFLTADGVPLSGWLLPARNGITIVYAHGLARSRRELLERAVALSRQGYGALLYDARNHGASGPARVTLGSNERLDVEGAVRYLRERDASGRIALFGISMGAAASLMAAAETPEVAAVIADSSFLSLEDTINHHIRLITPLPAFPLNVEIRTLLGWRGKFNVTEASPLEAVRRLDRRPVMFIAGARDPRMPPRIAEELHDASKSPERRLLIIDGPGADVHGHAYDADPQRYVQEIAQFLDDALGGAPGKVATGDRQTHD